MSKFRTMLEATFKEYSNPDPTDKYIIEANNLADNKVWFVTDMIGDNLVDDRSQALIFNNIKDARAALQSIYKAHTSRSTYDPDEVRPMQATCHMGNGEFRVYSIVTL